MEKVGESKYQNRNYIIFAGSLQEEFGENQIVISVFIMEIYSIKSFEIVNFKMATILIFYVKSYVKTVVIINTHNQIMKILQFLKFGCYFVIILSYEGQTDDGQKGIAKGHLLKKSELKIELWICYQFLDLLD